MTRRRRHRLGVAIAVAISAIAAAVIAAPAPNGMTACVVPMAAPFATPTVNACPNPISLVAAVNGSASGDVLMTNMGSGDLNLQGATNPSAPFSVSWGSDCPAGTCTLTTTAPPHLSTTLHVVFHPTAAGSFTDKVTLTTDAPGMGSYDIVLNGSTSAGMLLVSPTTVDLSAIAPLGTAMMLVSVTNMGTGPVAITGTSMSPLDTDWTITWDASCLGGSCTLAALGSTSFVAKFTANNQGPSDTVLSVLNDSGTTPTVALNGSGTGPMTQQLTVTHTMPFDLDFGPQNLGFTSSPLTFQLQNTGTVSLTGIAIAAQSATYAITPAFLSLMPTDAPATISVTCKPTTLGPHDETLTITPPGGTTVTPAATFTLHCDGVDGAVNASPSPIDLGEIRVGTQVAPVTITLSTAGAQVDITQDPVLVNAATNPGLAVSTPTPATITSTQSSTFQLSVDTATEDLDLADTIQLTAGSAVSIGVTGKITTPAIAHSTDLDLGTFCIGQPTPSSVATFKASGTATIVMQEPALALGAASPFSVTYTSPTEGAYASGYALTAGATAAISVHANDQAATGPVADQLVWPSDMPGEPMATTTLTAHFVDRGGAIAPGTVDFGPVSVHQTSEVRSVSLRNCGDAPITLAPVTIMPSGAFRDRSTTPLPASLGPGEIARIDLMFAPVKAGATHATLAVDTSTGPLSADLLGIGLGGADGPGDRTGFYACSCRTANPATGLPIVLAVAGVMVRRRRRAAG